jgi:hypothetical protein
MWHEARIPQPTSLSKDTGWVMMVEGISTALLVNRNAHSYGTAFQLAESSSKKLLGTPPRLK